MKGFIALLLACGFIMSGCSQKKETATEAPKPKFSTFSDHIKTVAEQNGISLEEAAKWAYSTGIEGVDVRITETEEEMAAYEAANLAHACAIIDIAHSTEPVDSMQTEAIKFCKKYNYTKLMYCPRLLPEGVDESARDSMLQGIKAFVDTAVSEGIELLFECYDNPQALTFNMAALDVLFATIPNARHTFDTGNFFYAGDDTMAALDKYRKLIGHVHLKDRYEAGDLRSPAAGTGVVPCLETVHKLVNDSYDGWFCIEGYGAENMKEHLSVSVENMLK